jgi:hypothetical protein
MEQASPASRDCGCNLIPRAKKLAPAGEAKPSAIRTTTSTLTRADRRDHFLARWGYKRNEHRVEPGLYKLGNPTPESPVFVSANYTLSFDALRSALAGVDGYILVLDTYGINVWCAAGKGTFGTDELVRRIEATGLDRVVNHRKLILPQLGAPGVAAHEVKKRTGFKIEYGPVRAADLPAYLETGQATPEMRRVRFPLKDRLVLVPVELVHVLWPLTIVAIGLGLLIGPLAAVGTVASVLAGVALFPILLPWLPTRDFSSKGLTLGGLVALPVALAAFLDSPEVVWWLRAGGALMYLLAMPPVTAFLALNFTGATTFTSKTGVRREMYAYIPVMAWLFGGGIVLTIAVTLIRLLG